MAAATFTASYSEHTGRYAILDATGRIVQDGLATRREAEQCARIRSMTPEQFARCSDAYRRGC